MQSADSEFEPLQEADADAKAVTACASTGSRQSTGSERVKKVDSKLSSSEKVKKVDSKLSNGSQDQLTMPANAWGPPEVTKTKSKGGALAKFKGAVGKLKNGITNVVPLPRTSRASTRESSLYGSDGSNLSSDINSSGESDFSIAKTTSKASSMGKVRSFSFKRASTFLGRNSEAQKIETQQRVTNAATLGVSHTLARLPTQDMDGEQHRQAGCRESVSANAMNDRLNEFQLRDERFVDSFRKAMKLDPFENCFRNDSYPLQNTIMSFVHSRKVAVIESVMLLTSIFSVTLTPVALVFGVDENIGFVVIDSLLDFLFACGQLARLRITVLDKNTEIRQPAHIARIWLRSRKYWISWISVLPRLLVAMIPGTSEWVHLLKLGRIMELLKPSDYFWFLRQSPELKMASLFLLPVLMSHVLTCLWIPASGYLDAYRSHNRDVVQFRWPEELGGGVFPTPVALYLIALVESIYLMLGLGLEFGERVIFGVVVQPMTNPAAMTVLFVMGLCGTVFSAVIFSSIVVLLQQLYMLAIHREETVTFLREAMEELSLPPSTQYRVQKLYDFQTMNYDRHALQVLFARENINVALDIELRIYLYYSLLQNSDLFADSDLHFTLDVIMALSEEIMMPGDYICRKGDLGREMFFLLQGEGAIMTDEGALIKLLFAGDYFGEVALIKDSRRMAWVRSNTYGIVLILGREQYHIILENFPAESDRLTRQVNQLLESSYAENEDAEDSDAEEEDSDAEDPDGEWCNPDEEVDDEFCACDSEMSDTGEYHTESYKPNDSELLKNIRKKKEEQEETKEEKEEVKPVVRITPLLVDSDADADAGSASETNKKRALIETFDEATGYLRHSVESESEDLDTSNLQTCMARRGTNFDNKVVMGTGVMVMEAAKSDIREFNVEPVKEEGEGEGSEALDTVGEMGVGNQKSNFLSVAGGVQFGGRKNNVRKSVTAGIQDPSAFGRKGKGMAMMNAGGASRRSMAPTKSYAAGDKSEDTMSALPASKAKSSANEKKSIDPLAKKRRESMAMGGLAAVALDNGPNGFILPNAAKGSSPAKAMPSLMSGGTRKSVAAFGGGGLGGLGGGGGGLMALGQQTSDSAMPSLMSSGKNSGGTRKSVAAFGGGPVGLGAGPRMSVAATGLTALSVQGMSAAAGLGAGPRKSLAVTGGTLLASVKHDRPADSSDAEYGHDLAVPKAMATAELNRLKQAITDMMKRLNIDE